MDYTVLGRTGLRVSVAGLGCGGSSRLGLARGASNDAAARLVRHCLDEGVNLIDTARVYGTEEAVGLALRGVPRDSVVVTTKGQIREEGVGLLTPARVVANLEQSLRALQLDHVDVFFLHGVLPDDYDQALDIRDALREARQAGKIRHLGITEAAVFDPEHRMLDRALGEPDFEVVMTAFHLLNQNTRRRVFPRTLEDRTGTLVMFAVRAIFSQPGRLQQTLRELAAAGKLPAGFADEVDPLGFLVQAGGARDLIDAAYRYVRHEPGVDVTLFGTGSAEHATANIASLLRPALPAADRDRLARDFGHLEGVGLTRPEIADR